jgi:hypothetical protein
MVDEETGADAQQAPSPEGGADGATVPVPEETKPEPTITDVMAAVEKASTDARAASGRASKLEERLTQELQILREEQTTGSTARFNALLQALPDDGNEPPVETPLSPKAKAAQALQEIDQLQQPQMDPAQAQVYQQAVQNAELQFDNALRGMEIDPVAYRNAVETDQTLRPQGQMMHEQIMDGLVKAQQWKTKQNGAPPETSGTPPAPKQAGPGGYGSFNDLSDAFTNGDLSFTKFKEEAQKWPEGEAMLRVVSQG